GNGRLETLIDVLGARMFAGAGEELVDCQALRGKGQAQLRAALAEGFQALFNGSGTRVHISIMNERKLLSTGAAPGKARACAPCPCCEVRLGRVVWDGPPFLPCQPQR